MQQFFINDEIQTLDLLSLQASDLGQDGPRLEVSLSSPALELDKEVSHQLIKVLRFKGGERVRLVDDSGKVFLVEIELVGKRAVARPVAVLDEHRENVVNTTLFLCRIKKDKFELTLQKATELGVYEIVPVESQRVSVRRPYSEEKQRIRFKKIIEEASEQSERHLRPSLADDITYDSLSEHLRDINLIAWERTEGESPNIYDKLQAIKSSPDFDVGKIGSASLLIGPEGGFTPEEVEKALAMGFAPVSLGPRILRAETAALAGLAAISQVLG